MKKRLLAVTAVAALALAGCGSGGSSGSSQSTGGSTLSGPPVKIGVVAPLKGASAYPEAQFGLDAATHYINTTMGGINGRPIDLDVCSGDGSPETAINCGNKLVADGVPLVIDANDLSLNAANPVLSGAGIPVVGTFPAHPETGNGAYGNGFFYTGPSGVTALGSMTLVKNLGTKTFAFITPDVSAGHSFWSDQIQPISQKLGMNGTPYYLSTSPNFTVIAASIIAQNPDMVVIGSASEDGCTNLFRALQTQNYRGKIFAGSCTKFIEAMGAKASGIYVQARTWLPAARDNAPADVQKWLDTFASEMKATGHGDNTSSRAVYAFAGAVNTAMVLAKVNGTIDKTSVVAAFKELNNFPSVLGPVDTCDGKQWPGSPSACSSEAITYEVANGKMKPTDPKGYYALDVSLIG